MKQCLRQRKNGRQGFGRGQRNLNLFTTFFDWKLTNELNACDLGAVVKDAVIICGTNRWRWLTGITHPISKLQLSVYIEMVRGQMFNHIPYYQINLVVTRRDFGCQGKWSSGIE